MSGFLLDLIGFSVYGPVHVGEPSELLEALPGQAWIKEPPSLAASPAHYTIRLRNEAGFVALPCSVLA